MATTSISITPQFGNNTVTAINCGTSSPRLSGTIDISSFPNLTSFTCRSNDITNVTGYGANTALEVFDCQDNAFAGNNIFEQFNNKPNLRIFNWSATRANQFPNLSGQFPDFSANTKLEILYLNNTRLSGTNLSFATLSSLQDIAIQFNRLGGTLPPLFLNNPSLLSINMGGTTGPFRFTGSMHNLSQFPALRLYSVATNALTGSISNLNNNTLLQRFYCFSNQLTGTIPNLTNNTQLTEFHCAINQLTGPIPSLSGLSNLQNFLCGTNQLTGFDGGSVSNTLGNFQAQSNQLTQTTVNTILSTFDATTRTTGTKTLNLGGTGNSAPSYTGGVTTVSAGNLFTTLGTTVTAACTNHNHPDGSLVTITGLQTVFTGTFAISSINANQFRYTVETNSPTLVTGTGTATMRRTTNANDGFRFFQNLARFGRLATVQSGLSGFPWTVTVNLP